MLPVDKNDTPDFDFMEKYIKDQRYRLQQRYILHAKKQLNLLGESKQIPSLEDIPWKEFFVTEIFQPPKSGKRITSQNYIDGNMPVVSSAGGNNGVIAFAGNTEKVRIYGNCLSVANGGVSAGFAFYHPYDFIATDHVTQYDFSREMTDPPLKREKIILPTKEDETPDFDYMEQYSKNILIYKYQQYLQYVNND